MECYIVQRLNNIFLLPRCARGGGHQLCDGLVLTRQCLFRLGTLSLVWGVPWRLPLTAVRPSWGESAVNHRLILVCRMGWLESFFVNLFFSDPRTLLVCRHRT